MFLHTYEIHLPYYSNPYVLEFDPDYRGEIGNFLSMTEKYRLEKKGNFTDADVVHFKALYDAQIRFTDNFIAKLLRDMIGLDLFSDTLIVLTSDHGERIWNRGMLLQHGFDPNEEVLRVPLIMVCPSIVLKGQEIDSTVTCVDIAPTICEFAGVKAPACMEGESLYMAAVKGAPLPKQKLIYAEDKPYKRIVALRFGDWKLYYKPDDDSCQLFNLSSDPREVDDLSKSKKNIASRFKRMLTRFIRSKPVGFYIVFAGDNRERYFEGSIVTDGIFSSADCYNIERPAKQWFRINDKERNVIEFKITAAGNERPIINVRTFPVNAKISLDVKMDGAKSLLRVFLGDRMDNPASLPCAISTSYVTERNPYTLPASKGSGCYVSYVPPPGLLDIKQEEMAKFSKVEAGATPAITKTVEPLADTKADKKEKEKEDEHRARLRALGYLD